MPYHTNFDFECFRFRLDPQYKIKDTVYSISHSKSLTIWFSALLQEMLKDEKEHFFFVMTFEVETVEAVEPWQLLSSNWSAVCFPEAQTSKHNLNY